MTKTNKTKKYSQALAGGAPAVHTTLWQHSDQVAIRQCATRLHINIPLNMSFSLRAHTRGRLSVDSDGNRTLAWHVKAWERFVLSMTHDGVKLLREDGVDTGLQVIDAGDDTVTRSKRYYLEQGGRYVSAHEDTAKPLSWATHQKAWEVWVVEPKTPAVAVAEMKGSGYTVLPGLLSGNEVAALKADLHNAEATPGVPSQDNAIQTRIGDLPALGTRFVKPAVDALLCSTLRDVLGPGVRCATWSSNVLKPGANRSGLGWHVDYPYHDIEFGRRPPSDVCLGVQVLFLLDDFKEDGSNGGTVFLPGSHVDTQHKPAAIAGDDVMSTGAEMLKVSNGGTAGAVLIAHSAWWHRQSVNRSAEPRTVLLGNYTPGFVVPKDGMERQWRQHERHINPSLSDDEQAKFADMWLGSSRRGNFE